LLWYHSKLKGVTIFSTANYTEKSTLRHTPKPFPLGSQMIISIPILRSVIKFPEESSPSKSPLNLCVKINLGPTSTRCPGNWCLCLIGGECNFRSLNRLRVNYLPDPGRDVHTCRNPPFYPPLSRLHHVGHHSTVSILMAFNVARSILELCFSNLKFAFHLFYLILFFSLPVCLSFVCQGDGGSWRVNIWIGFFPQAWQPPSQKQKKKIKINNDEKQQRN